MPNLSDEITREAEWIARVLRTSGYLADFTPASLREVERFFEEQSNKGLVRRGGLLAEDIPRRVCALGFYMGEVLRRNLGGEWKGDLSNVAQIEFHIADGMICWPTQRSGKRFQNGPEDNIAHWGHVAGLKV